jgi:hypothetical protein
VVTSAHRTVLTGSDLPDDATGRATFTTASGHELCSGAVDDGSVKCVGPRLTAGKYRVVVRYSGDANYLPSRSSFSMTVRKAPKRRSR